MKDLTNLVTPLPPLAEQKRIVAKVDALMALCGQLKAHLTNKERCSEHLLHAVVSQL
jgi:type I restriction enzyme, S subunit